MRPVLLLILAVCLAAASALAAEIPPGVHVLLRLQNSVTSRSAKVGDYVYLQTASPVVAEGKIVIPIGSYVQGVVGHVKRPGRVKGKAELGIRLETITLPTGQVYSFKARVASVDGNSTGQSVADSESTVRQDSSVGRDVANVAIMTASGASIGSVVGGINGNPLGGLGIGSGAGAAAGVVTSLFTRGNEVELNQGTSLDVVFEQVVELE